MGLRRSGRHAMTDEEITVEKTFEVKDSPDQAWKKLETLTADHDTEPGMWWLPGFQCRATEVAAAAGHRLEVVKAEQPCKDTTIVFTFEHVGTGTRIHVVQSGFDPAFVEDGRRRLLDTRCVPPRRDRTILRGRGARHELSQSATSRCRCRARRRVQALRLAIRSSRSVTVDLAVGGLSRRSSSAPCRACPAFAGPHPRVRPASVRCTRSDSLLFVPADLCCEVVDAVFEVAAFGAVGHAADGVRGRRGIGVRCRVAIVRCRASDAAPVECFGELAILVRRVGGTVAEVAPDPVPLGPKLLEARDLRFTLVELPAAQTRRSTLRLESCAAASPRARCRRGSPTCIAAS